MWFARGVGGRLWCLKMGVAQRARRRGGAGGEKAELEKGLHGVGEISRWAFA